MPTYEFTCPQGHDFDKFFRSMASAPTVVPCPVCGEAADRQMSAGAGLVFHGSGFYITDYGKDGKKDQKRSVKGDMDSRKDSADTDSKGDSGAESRGGEATESGSKAAESNGESKPSEPKGNESKGNEPKSGAGAASKQPEAPVKATIPTKAKE